MSGTDADQERWALVRWSALAEPGSRAAGALVGALGAAGAYRWLREGAVDLEGAVRRLPPTWDAPLARAVVSAHEAWWRRREAATALHEDRARAVGARVVTRLDPEYPAAMRDLGDDAPFALYVRGSRPLDEVYARSIAIVGARAATQYGAHMAAELVAGMAGRGWAIVSGGAYGIDARAHAAALAAGAPTAAAMAGGVDRLYPAGNEDLLRGVMDHGAVFSEVPPGFAPYRQRFLSRNRLIAAAGGTVVVEAAVASGALSTARHAGRMLRPVGAVPGPATSASSSGCHEAIRDGLAVLVASAEQAHELFASASEFSASVSADPDAARGTRPARPEFGSPHERAVFDALGRTARSLEDLAERAGLGMREASTALSALDIAGLAKRANHGWARAG